MTGRSLKLGVKTDIKGENLPSSSFLTSRSSLTNIDFPALSRYTYPMKEVNPMKKRDILSLVYQLASPVALILLGLVLIVSPDTASAMIARILGWAIFLVGIGFGIAAAVGKSGTVGKIVGAALGIGIGGFLVKNPLVLAAGIGRLLGILLILRGGRDIVQSNRRGHGRILAIVTTVVGVVLTVLPLTTSRLVFSICGVVVLLIGAAMLLDRLKDRRCLEDGGDPNIIDAL